MMLSLMGHVTPCRTRPSAGFNIQLVPRFGPKAHNQLTSKNSMEWSREFFLNAYFDKHIFQYLQGSRP